MQKEISNLPGWFFPYPHQYEVFEALEQGFKKFLLVWPRRAGKDLTNMGIQASCLVTPEFKNRTGWLIFPEATQARKAIWEGFTNTMLDGECHRYIDMFPGPEFGTKIRNDTMSLSLYNGSRFSVHHADPNTLVGSNPYLICMSEYSVDAKCQAAYDYLRPILRNNDGYMIIISTVRGLNHFHSLYQKVKDLPDWFVSYKTCKTVVDWEGNRLVSDEAIQSEREGGMSEEKIRSEFYSDWYAADEGTWYKHEIDRLYAEGRSVKGPSERPLYNPMWLVHTAWDLGYDGTAVWFFQKNPMTGVVHIIDFHHQAGTPLKDFVKLLNDRRDKYGYLYGLHLAPHDGKRRDAVHGQTTAEMLGQIGLDFDLLKKGSFLDEIRLARQLFGRVLFEENKQVQEGIEALRAYKKQPTELFSPDGKRIYKDDTPVHDWASHPADAFRYLAKGEWMCYGGGGDSTRSKRARFNGF